MKYGLNKVNNDGEHETRIKYSLLFRAEVTEIAVPFKRKLSICLSVCLSVCVSV